MADFNSSLPIRTENPGDVIVKISDATLPSQQLAVDSAGKIKATISQGGNDTTVTASNALKVDGSAVTQPVSGTVAVTQSTSPWITKDGANGSVTPGTVASFSELVGGQYNTALPTLTTGQQAAFQVDSSGRLIISPLAGSSVTVTNLPTTVDTNYGTVGASTLRSASQIGNATGSADFNTGATGAQTLRVTANQGTANSTPWNENVAQIAGAVPSASNSLPVQITTGSAFVSGTNPLPVILDPAGIGTKVDDYKDATSVASGASDSHDYTVTAAKTLHLNQIEASGSGKAKMVVAVETAVASGIFTTKFVQFNSTPETNMSIRLQSDILVAAGVRVRVTMSNRDLLAQDLYSTISGYEV